MTFPKTKKKYGQHFLYDLRVLKKIIEKADISKEDIVLEIGTGTGLLTKLLAQNAKSVFGFEIDKNLYDLVQQELKELSNITIINTDFLKYDLSKLDFKDKIKLVANIPYNLTSPIIEKLTHHKNIFSLIFLLVQEELAKRMIAQPEEKNYSSFSIFSQYHFDIKKLFNVSPKCFHPWPKVNSSYISLVPKDKPPYKVLSEDMFFKLVKAVFWGKRKMIRTSLLKSPYTENIDKKIIKKIEDMDISLNVRAEDIKAEDLARISNIIIEYRP